MQFQSSVYLPNEQQNSGLVARTRIKTINNGIHVLGTKSLKQYYYSLFRGPIVIVWAFVSSINFRTPGRSPALYFVYYISQDFRTLVEVVSSFTAPDYLRRPVLFLPNLPSLRPPTHTTTRSPNSPQLNIIHFLLIRCRASTLSQLRQILLAPPH